MMTVDSSPGSCRWWPPAPRHPWAASAPAAQSATACQAPRLLPPAAPRPAAQRLVGYIMMLRGVGSSAPKISNGGRTSGEPALGWGRRRPSCRQNCRSPASTRRHLSSQKVLALDMTTTRHVTTTRPAHLSVCHIRCIPAAEHSRHVASHLPPQAPQLPETASGW